MAAKLPGGEVVVEYRGVTEAFGTWRGTNYGSQVGKRGLREEEKVSGGGELCSGLGDCPSEKNKKRGATSSARFFSGDDGGGRGSDRFQFRFRGKRGWG
jgi:hypothetical protein